MIVVLQSLISTAPTSSRGDGVYIMCYEMRHDLSAIVLKNITTINLLLSYSSN